MKNRSVILILLMLILRSDTRVSEQTTMDRIAAPLIRCQFSIDPSNEVKLTGVGGR